VTSGGTVTPSLAVSDSAITGNSADGGAGRGAGSDGLGVGGGVYNLGDFSAVDTLIANNDASTSNDNIYP
jgi:hypothetical protein